MRKPLMKVLAFGVARSQEAETFFKEWAPQVDDPAIQALFAQLAAAERGRTEMLSRMVPEEMVRAAGDVRDVLDLPDLLVDIKMPRRSTLGQAIRTVVQRKGATAVLYERIAQLGGVACSFFRAMAEEDRQTICQLEEYAKQIPSRE
jgi:rubrerythrin